MTPTGYFLDHLWLVPLFPLATAALMLFFGRRLPRVGVSILCVGSVGLSFIYAVGAVLQLLATEPEHRVAQRCRFEWLTPGPMQMTGGQAIPFVADWGFLLDPLSSVMVLVVTGVGFLIHVYSVGYMAHEGGYYRFFGYMNLFMFAMLTLVLANNMLLMFVGWEGVGLCSYLLIGFYFLKKSASDAGKKAFIVNRIGDAGFILGILLTAVTLGTIRFTSQGLQGAAGILQALKAAVDTHALAYGAPVLTSIALLLFVGAVGKSAQIPLYVWLPDAMEGPTPVSALIHAATMVTAGVYMVARMNAIYQLAPFAMNVVAVVGVVTAIFAASMALVQNDIKKVLAYSTISQLGYMFLALCVGAFAAGAFDLMTHAFCKARLFLAARRSIPLIMLAGLSLIGGWIGWPLSLGGDARFEKFLEPVLSGVVAETGAEKIGQHGLAIEYILMLASLSIAGAGIWLAYHFYRTKRIAPELVAGKWP